VRGNRLGVPALTAIRIIAANIRPLLHCAA
jgi:hypothetical protein